MSILNMFSIGCRIQWNKTATVMYSTVSVHHVHFVIIKSKYVVMLYLGFVDLSLDRSD